jgi:hypothetical protein
MHFLINNLKKIKMNISNFVKYLSYIILIGQIIGCVLGHIPLKIALLVSFVCLANLINVYLTRKEEKKMKVKIE